MTRKPVAKPTERIKPKQAQADHNPPRPVEQWDLWDVFARSQEAGEAPEAAPRRPAKTTRRRGTRTP